MRDPEGGVAVSIRFPFSQGRTIRTDLPGDGISWFYAVK